MPTSAVSPPVSGLSQPEKGREERRSCERTRAHKTERKARRTLFPAPRLLLLLLIVVLDLHLLIVRVIVGVPRGALTLHIACVVVHALVALPLLARCAVRETRAVWRVLDVNGRRWDEVGVLATEGRV